MQTSMSVDVLAPESLRKTVAVQLASAAKLYKR